MARHHVVWVDGGREPTQKPDPEYPTGIDIDASLAYPARRCGQYVIACNVCGLTAICTTAGRPDDPRSIIVGCKALS